MALWEARGGYGDGVASVVLEDPGFKESRRETETWHHVAESESLKRGQ